MFYLVRNSAVGLLWLLTASQLIPIAAGAASELPKSEGTKPVTSVVAYEPSAVVAEDLNLRPAVQTNPTPLGGFENKEASSPAVPAAAPSATPSESGNVAAPVNEGITLKKIKDGIDLATSPKRALSFISGAFIGTPVCVVRKCIDEEKYGVHGMVGDTDNKLAKVSAGIFWFPFSIMAGTLESPVYATLDSAIYSNKPFSKEQFSIADIETKPTPPGGASASSAPASTSPASGAPTSSDDRSHAPSTSNMH